MSNSIKNFFLFFKASVRLVVQLRRQQKFILSNLEPYLDLANQSNDGSLEQADFKKIRNYYALFVVAIVGENYCRLRGTKMTLRERKALTFQGALTGLYDDFFDKEKWKEKPVLEMMNNPFTYSAKDSAEKLFLFFLQQVHLNLENKNDFSILFHQIYQIQNETKKQINSTLSLSELKTISEKKGGLSHLFYRTSLSNPLASGEYIALYELGSLLQQVNDIFDIWKDSCSGISTFASLSKDIKTTKLEFEQQLDKVSRLIKNLPYKTKNKSDFFVQLLILISMGIVSLNQYIDLQERNQGKFDATKFTREQLVCDMQKKSNLLKLTCVCLRLELPF
jgi:hypothetical protein